eukprot:21080-Heterococcus_DN1.PRE.1
MPSICRTVYAPHITFCNKHDTSDLNASILTDATSSTHCEVPVKRSTIAAEVSLVFSRSNRKC